MPNPGKGIKDVITVARQHAHDRGHVALQGFLVGYTMFGGAITLTDYQKQMPSAAMDQDGLLKIVPVLFCPKQMIIATTSTRRRGHLPDRRTHFQRLLLQGVQLLLARPREPEHLQQHHRLRLCRGRHGKGVGPSPPAATSSTTPRTRRARTRTWPPRRWWRPRLCPRSLPPSTSRTSQPLGIVPYDGAAPAQRAFGANEDRRQPAARDVLAVNRYQQRTIRDGQRAYVGAWNAAGELSLNPSVRPTPSPRRASAATVDDCAGPGTAGYGSPQHQVPPTVQVWRPASPGRGRALERDARRPPPGPAPPPANDVHPNAVGFPIWATVAVDVNGRCCGGLPLGRLEWVPAEDADQADEHGIVAHNLEDAAMPCVGA